MALFSRRPKKPQDEPTVEQVVEPVVEKGASDDAPSVDAPSVDRAAAVASVDVSISSFQGLGARRPAPARPAAAPPVIPAPETVPGIRDNVLVREALAGLTDSPTPLELMNVARQLMQGHLFLRVKGDARSLLAEGKGLPLAVATVGDRSFALAYSSGAALQASVRADGATDTSAMGQPVLIVLRHILAGTYDGLIVDHASAPARAVFPRALLEKLLEKFDEGLTVKTLLAEERTAATTAAVADALTRVPVWVAIGKGEGDVPGVAEARGQDGARFLELYSHPLEVAAMGRSNQAAPLSAAQLAGALRSDEGLAGVVIDPRGPWIRLSRADLAPVIALAR